jgi:hypothetical protein
VTAGEKRGTFKLKYISFKTFSAANPDKMTLLVENIAYTGYEWEVVVTPGPMCSVSLSTSDGQKVNRRVRRMLAEAESSEALGQHSADQSYTAYLTAKDEFGNQVMIESAKDVELDINDQAGEDLAYESQALVDGVLRIKFDPLKEGEYQVVVPNGCKGERKAYKIQVVPGALDTVQSSASVDVEANGESNTFTAGKSITFIATGKDKQGNVIDYTNNLEKFRLYAAYN